MALYNRKLTDEVQDTIVKALENGMAIKSACGQARISEPTFYNWYNKGAEKKSGKYRDFHDAVDNAKDVAQSNFENVIASPEMYNKPEKVMVNPKQDLSEFVEDKDKQDEIFDDI